MEFHLRKTVQAAGVLLDLATGSQMSYLRLIKLLYIADRECLAASGRPITGDRVVAMPYGPVFSQTLDIIKGLSPKSPEWDRYVQRDNYTVRLAVSPGIGELSRFEIKKLQEITRRYEDLDDWEIVELTHQFPEWVRNNPGQSSKPIPLAHILEAVGCGDRVEAIQRDIEEQDAISREFDKMSS